MPLSIVNTYMKKIAFFFCFLFAIVSTSYSQLVDANLGLNLSSTTKSGLNSYAGWIPGGTGLAGSIINPDTKKYGSMNLELFNITGSFINSICNEWKFMIGDYVGTGFGCGYIYMNDKYTSYRTTSNMYNGVLIREKIKEDKFGYNGYLDLGLMMRIRPSDEMSFGCIYYGHAYANNLLSSEFGFKSAAIGSVWAGYEKYFFKIGKSISDKGDYKYFNLELKGKLNDDATSPYLGLSYNRFSIADTYDGTAESSVQETTYNSVSLVFGIVWF